VAIKPSGGAPFAALILRSPGTASDDSVTRAISRIIRTDLIVVDEIGLLPIGENAAEVFYSPSSPPANAAPRTAPVTTAVGRLPGPLRR